MEPLAPHEKIYVDSDFAEDEFHGELCCHECHGGDPSEPDWKKAHEGVVKDPSYPDPSNTCGACHDLIAENYQSSLHVTLSPYKKIIGQRAASGKGVPPKVEEAMGNHCGSCHSSCGTCHISRPQVVGGGLLDGHIIQKRPPMQQVCTACHGSRVGQEYLGQNKGMKPDIHKDKYFRCEKCHKAEEMHGDGKEYAHRYQVENAPKCLDCHEAIFEPKAENAKNHWVHKDQVSCHVCHSQPYKNCTACHVGKDDHGFPYYKTKGSFMGFKIALNPLRSERRPEKFVTVRHVPIDHETFGFYAEGALKDFDVLPTWKYATPHNIRRKTPQNETCNACHGNEDLFLLKKDVAKEYVKANQGVIVSPESIPEERPEQP